jgi:glutamate N-acetyltransferase/amino-acid N-acetyltransferase
MAVSAQAKAQAAVTRPVVGVTAALGFTAGAARCGLYANPEKLDIAVLYSELPATAAAMFTTNKVKAAPVVISQLNLQDGKAQAIVANSGNANACTGSQGFKDALLMGKTCADELDLDPADVLVVSTGVIGRLMPMALLKEGIVVAARAINVDGGEHAARAIMTTDTRPKEAAAAFIYGDRTITVGGMAKGSGMIHVNLATMLGILTTDAAVAKDDLAAVLRRVVDSTFNLVTVDGDSSTNDMVSIMANGASGVTVGPGAGLEEFESTLMEVCISLSKQLARDGEGATRMFMVAVHGAASEDEARMLARTVASSNLVKAAIHGGDPNWGRIVAALGRAGCELVLDRLRVTIGDTIVFSNGAGLPETDLGRVRQAFESDEVSIVCELALGDGSATAYGCDLSPEYVHINADYTT